VPVELPHARYAIPAYYLVACAEASSNLARYDGCQYGYRAERYEDFIDMVCRTRSEGFGPEVKRRIMLGTYALSAGYYDAYYLKACKVRRLIAADFDAALERCNVILHPVAPSPAFKLGEKIDDPLAMYLCDVFTVLANLAGLPAVSVPVGSTPDGLPLAVQLTAGRLAEPTLLAAAAELERLAGA